MPRVNRTTWSESSIIYPKTRVIPKICQLAENIKKPKLHLLIKRFAIFENDTNDNVLTKSNSYEKAK